MRIILTFLFVWKIYIKHALIEFCAFLFLRLWKNQTVSKWTAHKFSNNLPWKLSSAMDHHLNLVFKSVLATFKLLIIFSGSLNFQLLEFEDLVISKCQSAEIKTCRIKSSVKGTDLETRSNKVSFMRLHFIWICGMSRVNVQSLWVFSLQSRSKYMYKWLAWMYINYMLIFCTLAHSVIFKVVWMHACDTALIVCSDVNNKCCSILKCIALLKREYLSIISSASKCKKLETWHSF